MKTKKKPSKLEQMKTKKKPSKLEQMKTKKKPSKLEQMKTKKKPSKLEQMKTKKKPSKLEQMKTKKKPSKLEQIQLRKAHKALADEVNALRTENHAMLKRLRQIRVLKAKAEQAAQLEVALERAKTENERLRSELERMTDDES